MTSLMERVHDALSEERLVGFHPENGTVCVWYGGYGFNVYSIEDGWREVGHFTSGDLAGLTDADRQDPDAYESARARMESEGFTDIS